MKRFLLGIIVLAVGIAAFGFYLGWFRIGSDSAGGTSNVTLSVDTKKVKEDSKTAVAKVQDMGHQAKDKIAGTGKESMDGTFVSLSGDVLTMRDKDGTKHNHTLPANISITSDGIASKASDLKGGMRIRVTPNDTAPYALSKIEAIDSNPAFASRSHEGKVVRITGNKLVMTNMDGKDEHTDKLTNETKITCDGKICIAADLKPGMRIRVTSEGADADTATRIEAIDKDGDFEIRNRLN